MTFAGAVLVWATVCATSPTQVMAELELRGLTDAVLSNDDDIRYLNSLRSGDTVSDPFRTRLFAEGGPENTRAFVQIILNDASQARVRIFGAYLMHQPISTREFYVQLGKIPTPQGTWGPRTYANKNPLVGTPLAYHWQTSLPVSQMPESLQDLADHRGQGQRGLEYDSGDGIRGERGAGSLLLYDNCWNDGLSVLGIQNGIEYQFAATLGAPGNPVNGVDKNDELALHARLGYAPIPEISVRLSWGHGAYLNRSVEPYLPLGSSVNDYKQQIWVLSTELSRGHFILHAEAFRNTFETPLASSALTSWSTYAELSWRFATRWNGAARFDTLRFGSIDTSTGRASWDEDINRWEAGIRFEPSRGLQLKAVVQWTDVGQGFVPNTLLPVLQTVVGF